MSARRVSSTIGFVLATALLAVPALTHEGHDHGAPEPASGDPNLVVRSASNDRYEVVMKYSSPRGRHATEVTVYVSDFETNAPVEGAAVGLRTTTPRAVSAQGAPAAAGVYVVTLPHEQAGRFTAILTIGPPPVAEFAFQDLPLGESPAAPAGTPGAARPVWWYAVAALVVAIAGAILWLRRRAMRPVSRAAIVLIAVGAATAAAGSASRAHEGHDHGAPRAAASAPAAASQPRYMAKEFQFLMGVRTVVARVEPLRARIEAVGHVTAESGALVSLEAPRDGKLEGARALAVGDRVQRGQLIANLLVIDRLPIRAPISGLVAEVGFTPGQWVRAGDRLALILDERRVRVELPLFGENLSRALRTRSGTVRSSALPGHEFPAVVRGLAPTAPETGAQGLEARGGGSPIPPLLLTVENRGGLLRPGMLVEASLELATAEELIAVPESAVVRYEGGEVVFVHIAPEVFEQRHVRVVGRYGARVGLAGDVRAGERIVVEGAAPLLSAPAVIPATPSVPEAAR